MGRRAEREDYKNIMYLIQRQILKRRYTEGKQNELYGSQPKFSRSVVRYTNLVSKDIENVILFKKKN